MFVHKDDLMVKPNSTIEIIWLSDPHLGNCNFARKEFKETIEYIKSTPNAYVLFGGDYIDAIVPNDKKRFDPSTLEKHYSIADINDLPRIQVKEFVELCNPIKDKILLAISGNHEESLYKYNNYDAYGAICEGLGLPKLGYFGFYSLGIKMRENRGSEYRINFCLNHGNGGGGKTQGAILNAISDTFSVNNADINLMGHIHLMGDYDRDTNTLTSNGILSTKRQTFASGGTYLRTYVAGNKNYFENKGRQPSHIGYLKLTIELKWDSWKCELTKVRL